MVSDPSIRGVSGFAVDAAPEDLRKEMLDQILAMVMKMTSDLEACNADLEACTAAFRTASPAFVADSDSSGSALAVHSASASASPTPSTASASPTPSTLQDADPSFQSGITELSYTRDPPVSSNGDLFILFDADDGDVDRLSRLPDSLLRNIVARLPIKDARRTAVLSRRWSPIWRTTPLLVGHADLAVNSDRFYSIMPRSSVGLLEQIRLQRQGQARSLLANNYVTKHDLSYTGVKLFGHRLQSDAVLDDVSCVLGRLLRRNGHTWPADLRTGVGTMLEADIAVKSLADHDPRSHISGGGFYLWDFDRIELIRCKSTRHFTSIATAREATITARVLSLVHTDIRHLPDIAATPIGSLEFLSAMHSKCSMYCRSGFTSMLTTTLSGSTPTWVSVEDINNFEKHPWPPPSQAQVFSEQGTHRLKSHTGHCSVVLICIIANIGTVTMQLLSMVRNLDWILVVTCLLYLEIIVRGAAVNWLFWDPEMWVIILMICCLSTLGHYPSAFHSCWYGRCNGLLKWFAVCQGALMVLRFHQLVQDGNTLQVKLAPWPLSEPVQYSATTQYIFNNHSAMVQRYYYMFVVHIEAFRPLPWPPWVFTIAFSLGFLLVSPLSLVRPPDTPSFRGKPHMYNSCIITLDPDIISRYVGMHSPLTGNVGVLLVCAQSCGLLHILSHGRGEASSVPLILFMSKHEEKEISPFTLESWIEINGLNPHEVITIDKGATCAEWSTGLGTKFASVTSMACIITSWKHDQLTASHQIIAISDLAAKGMYEYINVKTISFSGCYSTNTNSTIVEFVALDDLQTTDMLHSHLLDMFRAFSIPPNASNVRPPQGNKMPKPPWLLSTGVFGSWSGKIQLMSGFLLEVSPWCRDYMVWVQWQPQLRMISRGTNLQLMNQLMHTLWLQLYDSSLLPLVADPTYRDTCMLQLLPPPCAANYRHHVLLLIVLDTQKPNAAKLAHFLQFEVDLDHIIEAATIQQSKDRHGLGTSRVLRRGECHDPTGDAMGWVTKTYPHRPPLRAPAFVHPKDYIYLSISIL